MSNEWIGLDPTSGPLERRDDRELRPRPDALDGHVIGLVANGLGRGEVLLDGELPARDAASVEERLHSLGAQVLMGRSVGHRFSPAFTGSRDRPSIHVALRVSILTSFKKARGMDRTFSGPAYPHGC